MSAHRFSTPYPPSMIKFGHLYDRGTILRSGADGRSFLLVHRLSLRRTPPSSTSRFPVLRCRPARWPSIDQHESGVRKSMWGFPPAFRVSTYLRQQGI